MTQLEKIRNELIRNNKVYRNWCLSWFCTRLGAYIITLKREGFEFNPHNEGGDYVYEVVKRPEGLYLVVPISEYVKSKEYKEIEKFNEEHNFNLNGKVVKNSEVQSRLGFTLPPVRE